MKEDNGVWEIDELLEGEGTGLIGSFVEWLTADVSEGNQRCFVEGLNIDGSADSVGVNIDVVEGVGDVVCPWQLPLIIETSSIAKSPV